MFTTSPYFCTVFNWVLQFFWDFMGFYIVFGCPMDVFGFNIFFGIFVVFI